MGIKLLIEEDGVKKREIPIQKEINVFSSTTYIPTVKKIYAQIMEIGYNEGWTIDKPAKNMELSEAYFDALCEDYPIFSYFTVESLVFPTQRLILKLNLWEKSTTTILKILEGLQKVYKTMGTTNKARPTMQISGHIRGQNNRKSSILLRLDRELPDKDKRMLLNNSKNKKYVLTLDMHIHFRM